MTREIVMLGDDTKFSLSADRRRIGPWGVFGARSGGTSDCIVVSKDGKKRRLPSKITTTLTKGDKLIIVTPGGGGWGDPTKRDSDAVRRDVMEGLVRPRRARDVYGVVIDPATGRVDNAATRKSRGG